MKHLLPHSGCYSWPPGSNDSNGSNVGREVYWPWWKAHRKKITSLELSTIISVIVIIREAAQSKIIRHIERQEPMSKRTEKAASAKEENQRNEFSIWCCFSPNGHLSVPMEAIVCFTLPSQKTGKRSWAVDDSESSRAEVAEVPRTHSKEGGVFWFNIYCK